MRIASEHHEHAGLGRFFDTRENHGRHGPRDEFDELLVFGSVRREAPGEQLGENDGVDSLLARVANLADDAVDPLNLPCGLSGNIPADDAGVQILRRSGRLGGEQRSGGKREKDENFFHGRYYHFPPKPPRARKEVVLRSHSAAVRLTCPSWVLVLSSSSSSEC